MSEMLRNLSRRKLRNGLTISGIVVGIFALTAMGALSEQLRARPRDRSQEGNWR
jgi:hypothetical protein